MKMFLGELIGTMLLLLLGDGVVAAVVLQRTKATGAGWIVIAFGWAMAVFVGVFCVAKYCDAHLNPAVTIAMVTAGRMAIGPAMVLIVAQFLGAMIGSGLVYLMYRQHFAVTDDANGKLAVFCTGPAIRGAVDNLISEIIGTFVLIWAVLYITKPGADLGAIDALPVALTVLAIGLSLGATTGYAINPARDLGPRIMHQLLPIPGKRDSDWGYAWVPVVGPILGAVLAVLLSQVINNVK